MPKDASIWSVDAQGKNLAWCVQDVLNQLPLAFTWFSQFDSKDNVLQILFQMPEHMTELWGYGRNPSPIRSYLAGYVALAVGNEELAKQKLGEAVDSNCFVNLFTTTEGALNRAL